METGTISTLVSHVLRFNARLSGQHLHWINNSILVYVAVPRHGAADSNDQREPDNPLRRRKRIVLEKCYAASLAPDAGAHLPRGNRVRMHGPTLRTSMLQQTQHSSAATSGPLIYVANTHVKADVGIMPRS